MKKTREQLYRSLRDASNAAVELGITSELDYRKKYKRDPKLPAHPYRIYSNKWTGWLVFLKTGLPNYPTVLEASGAARKLGIVNSSDYKNKHSVDPKLPSNPSRSYADKWFGWEQFLGVEIGKYPTYEEASKAARKLKIQSYTDYIKRYKLDPKLVSAPKKQYSGNWIGWNEFLGLVKPTKYKTLAQASSAAITLNIKTMKEYKLRYKEDARLVSNPNREYLNEWVCVKEFLGTGKKRYNTLAEASAAAIQLGISSSEEYANRYKEDPCLRSCPYNSFASEWRGWSQFLGIKPKPKKYATLLEATHAAHALGITSQSQYHKKRKKNKKLPSNPADFYSESWIDWYDFLGKERCPYYDSLKEASAAAIALNIISGREYYQKYRLDPKLHSDPSNYYSDWTSWYDFLDTKIARYETLELASAAAQNLGIQSAKEYSNCYVNDSLLPAVPSSYYKESWNNWNEFLNYFSKYRTIKEASAAAIKLGVTGPGDYRSKYKQDKKLYAYPNLSYSADWASWDSFLGMAP